MRPITFGDALTTGEKGRICELFAPQISHVLRDI